MKLIKFAATYSMLVGISMIGLWATLFFSNEIPEINSTPIAVSMHIAAEMATAILLIFSSIGLLLKKIWGLQMYMFSMGMLVYTQIQSPGYYAEKGEWAFVVMFAITISISLIFVILSLLKRDEFTA
jgi:hypothetical protein